MREYKYLPEAILPHDRHSIEVETKKLEFYQFKVSTYTINHNGNIVNVFTPLLENGEVKIYHVTFSINEIKSIKVDGKDLPL